MLRRFGDLEIWGFLGDLGDRGFKRIL